MRLFFGGGNQLGRIVVGTLFIAVIPLPKPPPTLAAAVMIEHHAPGNLLDPRRRCCFASPTATLRPNGRECVSCCVLRARSILQHTKRQAKDPPLEPLNQLRQGGIVTLLATAEQFVVIHRVLPAKNRGLALCANASCC